ncbi:MAG: hypothetical protein ACRC2T_19740 [Thermoguttaceae bacterium]
MIQESSKTPKTPELLPCSRSSNKGMRLLCYFVITFIVLLLLYVIVTAGGLNYIGYYVHDISPYPVQIHENSTSDLFVQGGKNACYAIPFLLFYSTSSPPSDLRFVFRTDSSEQHSVILSKVVIEDERAKKTIPINKTIFFTSVETASESPVRIYQPSVEVINALNYNEYRCCAKVTLYGTVTKGDTGSLQEFTAQYTITSKYKGEWHTSWPLLWDSYPPESISGCCQ